MLFVLSAALFGALRSCPRLWRADAELLGEFGKPRHRARSQWNPVSPARCSGGKTALARHQDRGRVGGARHALQCRSKALDLAYFSGMTHTEIAEKLKVPLGTAKTWVRTGLQTLRERLARFVEPNRKSVV